MSWVNSIDDCSKQRNSYNISLLKGIENYELWFIRIRALLVGNELAFYISQSNFGIELVIEGDLSILLFKEVEKIKSIILLNLVDESLVQIQHIEKSYDIWKTLRNLYVSKRFSNDFYLCKKIFNTTLKFCESKMKNYINNLKRISDQLYAKNIKLFDKVIFAWAFDNLIEEYDDIVTTIIQTIRVNGDKALNLKELFVNLIDESKRVITRNKKTALYIKHDKKRNKSQHMSEYRIKKPITNITQGKCSYCKRDKHAKNKCWFKHSELRFKLKEKKSENTNIVEKIAMFVFDSFVNSLDISKKYTRLTYSKFKNESESEFAYCSILNRFQFILNSKVTIHICCEKFYFREIKSCNSTVSWDKISRIKASDIDSVSIIFNDTNQKAILQNCLYVSEFQINLISIHKLLKNYKVIFDNYCYIYTKDSQKLMSRVTTHDKLFVFSIISNLKKITNTTIVKSNAEKH